MTYPLERALHVCPALSPERVALQRISLGQTPFLHALRDRQGGVVQALLRYYGSVRLPVAVEVFTLGVAIRQRATSTVGTGVATGSPFTNL